LTFKRAKCELYQFYNADLLNIPSGPNQLAIAYVDNTILFASSDTFKETHKTLLNMMTKEEGVIAWSTDHNSPLKYFKLTLIDFAHHSCHITRPTLNLLHNSITPQASAKYLRIVIDQHLNWTQQWAHIIEKGSNWLVLIKHIARPSWGVMPKYARHLFIGVALLKILYGTKVWYHPLPAER
jgi:hypothetical protein